MNTNDDPVTHPQPQETTTVRDDFDLGLVANDHDSEETRFLLTPEVCGLLCSSNLSICMETGAASSISYTDEKYASFGVHIVERETALLAEYVLSYAPLGYDDVMKMKDGAKLLCMFDAMLFRKDVLEALNSKNICVLCLDKVVSHNGVPVFANIVDEVDGRAALWYAQEALSFLGGGKGVLLGGVPGIDPCEVLVFGEGSRALAAVKAALALRASVTLMDNDISALQLAQAECGPTLATCVIHPRTLTNKVKSADVIILDNCTNPFEFPLHLKGAVKEDAFILDFNETSPSISTPRTVTMAVASCLYNFFNDIQLKHGFENALVTTPGMRIGVITYEGHVTNKLVASVTATEYYDLEVMLSSRN